MRVLVVGGGVGGLAVAASLRDHAEVTVVEQAPAWKPVGAALLLHANAMAALDVLGVDVSRCGAPVENLEITDAAGRCLGPMRMADFPAALRTARVVPRADLHEALLARAGEVRLDTSVAAIEGGRARLTDGTEGVWDVVVGADGIRSTVRKLLYGAAAPTPTYLGYTCWRWIGPDPGVGRMIEMWGRGKRIGLCPLGGGRLYGFLVANAAAGTTGTETPAVLRERFAGFGGPAPAALAGLDEAVIRHDDLCDLPEAYWGRGPVVLIGDAAHAQTPNLGQGAASALEDAVVLGRLFRSGEPVDLALDSFVRARTPRVRELQKLGRRLGAVAQWESPFACAFRDWVAWATPASMNARLLVRVVGAGVEALEHGALAAP